MEGAADVSVTLLQPASQLHERGLVIQEATLAPDDDVLFQFLVKAFPMNLYAWSLVKS